MERADYGYTVKALDADVKELEADQPLSQDEYWYLVEQYMYARAAGR